MKMWIAMIGLASLLLAVGCTTTTPAERTFLHTRGHDIVDGQGNRVLLRGVGLGNWLLPEGYMWKFGSGGDRPRKIENIVAELAGEDYAAEFWREWRRNYITEADIRRIAELGYNSVRPALNARIFLTEGDSARYIEESFVLLDSLIRWCDRHDLYVIIDMHGAPGGQTGANIDDSPNDQPELFMDPRNRDRLVDLWVKIAKRYRDEPTVAAYDLLNEPLPAHTGAAEEYGHMVEPLYKRLTAAIRAVDPHHMITIEGVNWSNDWSIFGPPFDDNLIYQFHYYCWDRPDNLNDISHYIARRESLDAPVWVGETGEKGNTIYWGTTQYFEANNIGWSFWPWKKMDTRNTPYSINRPADWDAIAAYSRGEEAPPGTVARRAFDELLENIRLVNCVYFPDVVNSMFRRAPVRIEAENYGHDGYGQSYDVADTSHRAATYRVTEPVPIELIDFTENQFLSEQAIRLKAGEWTHYTMAMREPLALDMSCRVQAISAQAEFDFVLDDATYGQQVSGDGWQTIAIPRTSFDARPHEITIRVTDGELLIDWIDLVK